MPLAAVRPSYERFGLMGEQPCGRVEAPVHRAESRPAHRAHRFTVVAARRETDGPPHGLPNEDELVSGDARPGL